MTLNAPRCSTTVTSTTSSSALATEKLTEDPYGNDVAVRATEDTQRIEQTVVGSRLREEPDSSRKGVAAEQFEAAEIIRNTPAGIRVRFSGIGWREAPYRRLLTMMPRSWHSTSPPTTSSTSRPPTACGSVCVRARSHGVRPRCAPRAQKQRTQADSGGLKQGRAWARRRTAQSAQPCAFLAPGAAGVGFEPTIEVVPDAGFQDRCVQPLRHPAWRRRP